MLSAALVFATVAAGLAVRLVPLGLPGAAVKYGGSLLWAAMVYWLVSALRPHWPVGRAAVAAGAVALGVELFKLYHAPWLDAFRATLAGRLLLGRVFSAWDLLAYAVTIAAAACADRMLR